MATVDLFDRITVEPGKCGGKPCIRGMRITVRRVLELLATHPDRAALLSEYPFLRSEEHTSELQSLRHLVCRLLLEKKKRNTQSHTALRHHSRAHHQPHTSPPQ